MVRALLALIISLGMLRAATIAVPDSAAFPGALDAAVAGDTLLLAADSYGDVSIGKAEADFVTVTSADEAHGAVFGGIMLQNAAYVRLDGLTAFKIQTDDTCRHIDILNCIVGDEPGMKDLLAAIRIAAGTYSDFRIEGNYLRNAINGAQVFGCSSLVFRENIVDSVRGDSYKFGDIIDGLIENNFGAYHYYTDSLAHHDFMQWQGVFSKNVVIRGNVNLVGETSSQAQGIFGGDPAFQNLLIEDNIIYLGSARAISIPAGTLITVRNNTVLTFPGVLKSSIILPDGAVNENNITAHRASNAGPGANGNYVIQHEDSTADFYYNDYYQNAMAGKGCIIEDLRPVPGSPADGVAGAYRRINELLGASVVAQPTVRMDVHMEGSGAGLLYDLQGRLESGTTAGFYIRYDAATERVEKVMVIP